MGATLAAGAATLTPEQALARVGMSTRQAGVKALTQGTPRLLMTQSTVSNEPTVYVFAGQTAGYLIVSADDVAPALLGYADAGKVDDTAQMSPELLYWIGEYSRQIEWAKANGAAPMAAAATTAGTDMSVIEPLTTTKWNQNAPYNDDCPIDSLTGERCVTGCVSTALSQVMKYHNWPPTGTGSNTYTPQSVGHAVTVDYAATTYDWDNMLNTYGADATAAQKNAVATLMLSTGVAVNMDYTSNESGSMPLDAASAMAKYFRYDKGIIFYNRSYYGIDEWNQLVHNQLANYGPVQYSGQSNTGGHSWVCDGYEGNGYFHINWGWGGMSNGYFLLTALNPLTQGIGGSTSGYNFDQSIIGNVKPDESGTSTYIPNFVADNFALYSSTGSTRATLGSTLQVSGPIYSYSLIDISGTLGVKLTSADGTVHYATGMAFQSLGQYSGYNSYQVQLPSNLPAGTYTATPAVRSTQGEWYDVPVQVGAQRQSTVTVSGSTATITNATAATLTMTNIQQTTPFYLGSTFEITATVTNNSSQEYYSTIYLALVNSDGSQVGEGYQYPIDLEPGQSTDITYASTFSGITNQDTGETTTLTAGSYRICFVDANGNQLSPLTSITLNAASTPTLNVTSLAVNGDATQVEKNNVQFNVGMECTDGYFGSSLTLVIFPYTSGSVQSVASFNSDPVFLSAGQSKNFAIKGDFNDGTEGKEYFAMLYNGQSPVSDNQAYFKLAMSTGVDDISADNAGQAQYYTLSGIKVTGTPAPGLYIRRQGTTATKVVID